MKLVQYIKEANFEFRDNEEFIDNTIRETWTVSFGDLFDKNYGKKQTFMNKTILFLDIVEHEGNERLILYGFEFAKPHLTSQNLIYIRKNSDLEKIFEKIDPRRTGRLTEVKTPFSEENMLMGLHIVGITEVPSRYLSSTYLKKIIEVCRENGKESIKIDDKEVYLLPIGKELLKEKDCVLIANNRNNKGVALRTLSDKITDKKPNFTMVY